MTKGGFIRPDPLRTQPLHRHAVGVVALIRSPDSAELLLGIGEDDAAAPFVLDVETYLVHQRQIPIGAGARQVVKGPGVRL